MTNFDYDYYLAAMRDNFSRSSRTVSKGIVDKTESGARDKPDAIITDAERLKTKATDNALSLVGFLHDEIPRQFATKYAVLQLVDDLARGLNKGILDPSLSSYRTHEVKSPLYGCSVREIKTGLEWFASWAVDTFNCSWERDEVVVRSAMIEKIIDTDIHPLADGCGRLAKLLSTYLAMKNDAPVKAYADRKSYLAAMGRKEFGVNMFNPASVQGIVEFYRALPDFELKS